ncbi:MAG: hypothetical protein Q9199_001888 [Rusavskia elegans]
MRIRPEQKLDTSTDIASAPEGLKLDQISARYGQVLRELEEGDESSFKYQIQYQFGNKLRTSKVPKDISKCLCTSLGSFTTNKYKDEYNQANRPMYQLAAFEYMKTILEGYTGINIESKNVMIQDPEMNDVDKQWLETVKEYKVINDPQAIQEVDTNVFVYTPCAWFSHVRSLFSSRVPKLYVGVNVAKWITHMQPKDEYNNRGTLNDELRNNADAYQNVHDTYVVPFLNNTTSEDILIMKDTYKWPRVTAYY